jgi:hypothetical protein
MQFRGKLFVRTNYIKTWKSCNDLAEEIRTLIQKEVVSYFES